MQPPLMHRFTIDGEPFCLVEYNHAEERLIQAKYAQLIAPAPLLDYLFADDLYAEATAAVCVKEAPAWCWQTVPPGQPVNGTPTRVFDISQSPRTFWPKLRAEIDVFRGLLRDSVPAPRGDVAASEPGSSEPDVLASPQTVSPAFRGHAV
jgi:hypothetical protein